MCDEQPLPGTRTASSIHADFRSRLSSKRPYYYIVRRTRMYILCKIVCTEYEYEYSFHGQALLTWGSAARVPDPISEAIYQMSKTHRVKYQTRFALALQFGGLRDVMDFTLLCTE